MVPLRKERAGSCNLGYTWPEDGWVVPVTPEHAALLLAVPDGDFTVAGSTTADEAEPPQREIEEPAPEPGLSEAPEPRKAPAKRTAAKKTAASPAVEE